MRWRYLILALFLAVPTATAIQVWPQRLAFAIPGRHRHFLADDEKTNQLLFVHCAPEDDAKPRIEYYDGDSGKLTKTTTLDLGKWHGRGYWARVSDDGNSLSWLLACSVPRYHTRCASDWAPNSDLPPFDLQGKAWLTTFDLPSGQIRSRVSVEASDNHFDLAPNGDAFAVLQGKSSQLAVFDARTGQCQCKVQFPLGEEGFISSCFSPDGRKLLYQRYDLAAAGRLLHLVNLSSGEEEWTSQLPEGQMLCEWRPGELRCYENSLRFYDWLPTRRHRYVFDGKTLGPGTPDPLFDCDYRVLASPNGSIDTEKWVGQFEKYPPRQPAWADWIAELEIRTGIRVFDHSKVPYYMGCVRVINRATKTARFEKHVQSIEPCRLALDGKVLIIDRQEVPLADLEGIDCGVALASLAHTPGGPFEIYRTDIWPRWIWTTLGTGTLLTAFALLARWPHVVIQRRKIAALRM